MKNNLVTLALKILKNRDLNTARCPMAYDKYFLRFVKMKFVKDIVSKCFRR